MKKKPSAVFVLSFTAALAAVLLLTGCGGGGGSLSGEGSSSTNNGTVALFLADGPAENYDSIFISILASSGIIILLQICGRDGSPSLRRLLSLSIVIW